MKIITIDEVKTRIDKRFSNEEYKLNFLYRIGSTTIPKGSRE